MAVSLGYAIKPLTHIREIGLFKLFLPDDLVHGAVAVLQASGEPEAATQKLLPTPGVASTPTSLLSSSGI